MPALGRGRVDAEKRLARIRAAIVGEDAAVVRLGPHRRDLITGFA